MDYSCLASPFDQDEELEHEYEVLADARGEMQRQEGDEYEEEEEEEDYIEDEEPFAPPPAEQAGSSEQPWRNVPWQQLRADRTKRTRRSEPSDGDSSFGDGLDSHVNPGAARSAAGDEEDMFYDEEEEDDQRPEVITRRNTKVDADCFDDYNKKIMGHGVTQSIPEFKHSSSAWTKSADAKDFVNGTMRPIRTLVWNIPVGLFMKDAAKFRDWVTPKDNAMRAAHIAAVVSFCFTGLSKGFLCARARARAPAHPPALGRARVRAAGPATTRRSGAPTARPRRTRSRARTPRRGRGACTATPSCCPRTTT